MAGQTTMETNTLLRIILAQLGDCPTPDPWLGVKIALFCGVQLVLLGLVVLALRRGYGGQGAETQDTARRVLRNSAIPLVLQIVTKALDFGFAVFVLYALLCKAQVGRYDFAALLVVMYLGTIADFGLTIVVIRDIVRQPAEAPLYFRTMVRLRTWLGLAAIPLAFSVPLLYMLLHRLGITREEIDAEYFVLIGLLALTLLPGGYSAAVTALFHAAEKMHIPATIGVVTNILSTLLRTAALVLGLGLVGVAAGALLATLLSALVFAVMLRRSFGPIPLRGPQVPWRPLLREGWPLMLNSLLLFVFFRFDVFIITPVLGDAATGAYNAAYRYINLTQILPPLIVNALFPLLTRRAHEDRQAFQHAYHYTLRLLLLLALPLATGMSLLAAPLITLMTEESYIVDAAPALAILIWYLPLAYVNGLTQYALIALNQARTITWAFGITAVFNLAANLICIPIWGLNAAAAITVASEMVLYALYRRTLRKVVGAPPLARLVWRPALACLALGALLFLRREAALPAALLLAAPIYLGLLAALRTLTDEDRRILRRLALRGDRG
jgi:O-antigen/teichoic acid export membrane protein